MLERLALPLMHTTLKLSPPAAVSAISSNLTKKALPFYSPISTTTKATKSPSLLLFPAIRKRKAENYHALGGRPKFMSFGGRLLVHDQTIPPEVPGRTPPEIPGRSDPGTPSIPPEVLEFPRGPEIETSPPEVNTQPSKTPEIPTPGHPAPEIPVPPPPTSPTPPDIPVPPPGTPRLPPPNKLPPGFPPDPDILPPPIPSPPDIRPPPDTSPDIKPPPWTH